MRFLLFLLLPSVVVVHGCADEPPPVAPRPTIAAVVRADEKHLVEIQQLTHGGDNRRARWSWASDQLLVEARGNDAACEQIVRVGSFAEGSAPKRTVVGAGRTPSFLPGDQDIVYAASSDPSRCVRRAEPSIGAAVQADAGAPSLDPDLDIYRAKADGSSPRKLTDSAGYDGQPAVCGKDGSIVFTSTRDGDADLYRMDADGGNVRRLTASAGYDGDAAFDADCRRIVWSAVRRPGTSELWGANADGTEARQITYLDALSYAPAWHPSQTRLLFTSTYGGTSSRDVDVWAVDADGTSLERVTTAPAFDGFPFFSPDGKQIAFSSMRATLAGDHDVDVMLARWTGAWRHVEERPADHLMGDAAWLADPAREGRGLGTKGLEAAGAYIERSFRDFGLTTAGEDGFRQGFDVATKVSGQAMLQVEGVPVDGARVRPLGFSASSVAEGPLVFFGSEDDYAHVDARGKIVVVRAVARSGLRHAGWLARDHGAVALLVIAEGAPPDPAVGSDVGLPAAVVSADAIGPLLARLVRGQRPPARLAVTLATETASAFNVVGLWPAAAAAEQKLPGVIVVGAHYDHIGERSPGADDNASGTAALLQIARSLAEQKTALRRDVVLAAFSGEEKGAAGATAFLRHLPGGIAPKDIEAMINLDMVGRLRDNTLQIFGEGTATQWPDLMSSACAAARVECAPATAGGFGASDHTPFYEAGVPVLHLFTGVHGDYLQPTDTVDKLNAAGMAQVARVAEELARDLSDLGGRLDYHRVGGSIESSLPTFRVTLGTIPDGAAPPKGQKGMLLAGVRPGGPADKAGLRRGDLLVRLGGHAVAGVDDVMFVLTGAKPGAKLNAVVLRDGKEVSVELTLEEVR